MQKIMKRLSKLELKNLKLGSVIKIASVSLDNEPPTDDNRGVSYFLRGKSESKLGDVILLFDELSEKTSKIFKTKLTLNKSVNENGERKRYISNCKLVYTYELVSGDSIK